MPLCRLFVLLTFGAAMPAGCATRPVNAPNAEGGRLRSAAAGTIEESPEFRRLLRDVGAKPVPA